MPIPPITECAGDCWSIQPRLAQAYNPETLKPPKNPNLKHPSFAHANEPLLTLIYRVNSAYERTASVFNALRVQHRL